MSGLFDLQEFFRAIDSERKRHDLSWQALAHQVGVAASTIRRFGEAEDAEADGVLALLQWLGVAPEDFIETSSGVGVPLHDRRGGFIRVDMGLVAEAQGIPRDDERRTRTTIQRLVEVALRSGRPVASLTRRSET